MYQPGASLEQANKALAVAREHLASAAKDGSVHYLNTQVKVLVKLERKVHVLTVVDRILLATEGADSDQERLAEARNYVHTLLTGDANDTYSGRDNDLARVAFEGVQDVARDLEWYRA